MNSQPNTNSQPSTSTFPIALLPPGHVPAPAPRQTVSIRRPSLSTAVYQGRCDDVPGPSRYFLPRRLTVY